MTEPSLKLWAEETQSATLFFLANPRHSTPLDQSLRTWKFDGSINVAFLPVFSRTPVISME